MHVDADVDASLWILELGFSVDLSLAVGRDVELDPLSFRLRLAGDVDVYVGARESRGRCSRCARAVKPRDRAEIKTNINKISVT